MLEWILYSIVGLLVLLLVLLVIRKRRSTPPGVGNVNFGKYKSEEIHQRGHYHDIVK